MEFSLLFLPFRLLLHFNDTLRLSNSMKLSTFFALGAFSYLTTTKATAYQNISNAIVRVNTGQTGPAVEEVHYYYNKWPFGLAVSKRRRIFACFTRGTFAYTLEEVANSSVPKPYTSHQMTHSGFLTLAGPAPMRQSMLPCPLSNQEDQN